MMALEMVYPRDDRQHEQEQHGHEDDDDFATQRAVLDASKLLLGTAILSSRSNMVIRIRAMSSHGCASVNHAPAPDSRGSRQPGLTM
jgi:hypothetical protein